MHTQRFGSVLASAIAHPDCRFEALDLSQSHMEASTRSSILQSLWANRSIRYLTLIHIGLTSSDINHIVDAMGTSRVSLVNLNDNQLQSYDLAVFFEVSIIMGRLQVLDLSNNEFDMDVIHAMGKAIVMSESLRTLYLYNCGIDDEGQFNYL